MIFNALNQAADHNELIIVHGGLCHWHLRRDGQITIREIIVLPHMQRQGIGQAMLQSLKQVAGATSIFAKCPANLTANAWYQHMHFTDEGTQTTPSGRQLRLWRLKISPPEE